MLIALLILLQIHFGSIASVAADDEEHTYVILEDDFEDGDLSDWRVEEKRGFEGKVYKVEKEDDNHVLSAEMGEEWAGGLYAGDPEWTEYTIEFNTKLIKGMIEFGFRHAFKPGGAASYVLQIGHSKLELIKGDESFSRWTELKKIGVDINPDTWYDVKIVCIENKIKIYLDDYLKIDYTDEDNPFLSGEILLCVVEGFEGGSHAHFDDVKVSTTRRLYVTYLIKEAEDDIRKSGVLGCDTVEADEKLAEAQAAFDNGDFSLAESLANEAIDLAKHASLGPVSVAELLNYSAERDQHTVEVSGTIRDIRYDEGVYRFAVDDGTGVISATFNGTLGEIKSEDKVKIVGMFDAPSGAVIASKIEKISAPPTTPLTVTTTTTSVTGRTITTSATPSITTITSSVAPTVTTRVTGTTLTTVTTSAERITWSIELITALITICAAAVGGVGWVARTQSMRKRRKVLFKKLMDEVDEVYSRFKMNARRCEAELYKLRDQALDGLKQGVVDEKSYNTLEERIDDYMKEIREQIETEKP